MVASNRFLKNKNVREKIFRSLLVTWFNISFSTESIELESSPAIHLITDGVKIRLCDRLLFHMRVVQHPTVPEATAFRQVSLLRILSLKKMYLFKKTVQTNHKKSSP